MKCMEAREVFINITSIKLCYEKDFATPVTLLDFILLDVKVNSYFPVALCGT